jgi:DNA-directed RNA polymerase subunit RPC12/RpoP
MLVGIVFSSDDSIATTFFFWCRFILEPFIVGTGDIDYICGRCDNIIAQNISQSQIASDAVFQCPNCQTFNEIE